MTAVSAPEQRVFSQPQEALQKANRIRIGRAERKLDLREGRLDIADVIDAPDEYWQTCKVEDCLMCLPRIGRHAAYRIMLPAGVSATTTLGGMTTRQRRSLYDSLCKYGPQGRFS